MHWEVPEEGTFTMPLVVLILVFVEYALGVRIQRINDLTPYGVLILVFVEYALGEQLANLAGHKFTSLNPCFSGICAARSISGREFRISPKS